MSSTEQPSRHGWWARILELGPAWITAIATVIVALGGVGFFAGRASAPTGTPASTGQPTQTATPSAAATTAGGAWIVLWRGSVGINNIGLNFDNRPPSSASGDIKYNGSLSSVSTATLAVWPQSAVPTAALCQN